MTKTLNWARFAEAHPELAASIQGAQRDYDRRYSSFWQDGPARLLHERIDAGELDLNAATTCASHLAAEYRVINDQHPNLGERSAKHRIGAKGLGADWRISRTERDQFADVIAYTITTISSRRPTRVRFGRAGQILSASWTDSAGEQVAYGSNAETVLVERLTAEEA